MPFEELTVRTVLCPVWYPQMGPIELVVVLAVVEVLLQPAAHAHTMVERDGKVSGIRSANHVADLTEGSCEIAHRAGGAREAEIESSGVVEAGVGMAA